MQFLSLMLLAILFGESSGGTDNNEVLFAGKFDLLFVIFFWLANDVHNHNLLFA